MNKHENLINKYKNFHEQNCPSYLIIKIYYYCKKMKDKTIDINT